MFVLSSHCLCRYGLPVLFFFFFKIRYGFGELSPVCAIVGGVLGQEVIKVSLAFSCCFCTKLDVSECDLYES